MDDVADLYRRHAGDLLRFARTLTGDASLAEDAVAETFARVLDGPPLPAGAAARPWLFGVTRHVCLDLQRERSRRRASTGERDAPFQPEAEAPGPDSAVTARAALAATLADLDALPEDARAALILRAQEGLSYEEIAVALSTTPGAAKVRVHRARAALTRARAEREELP